MHRPQNDLSPPAPVDTVPTATVWRAFDRSLGALAARRPDNARRAAPRSRYCTPPRTISSSITAARPRDDEDGSLLGGRGDRAPVDPRVHVHTRRVPLSWDRRHGGATRLRVRRHGALPGAGATALLERLHSLSFAQGFALLTLCERTRRMEPRDGTSDPVATFQGRARPVRSERRASVARSRLTPLTPRTTRERALPRQV